jgi:hypothetical protein
MEMMVLNLSGYDVEQLYLLYHYGNICNIYVYIEICITVFSYGLMRDLSKFKVAFMELI